MADRQGSNLDRVGTLDQGIKPLRPLHSSEGHLGVHTERQRESSCGKPSDPALEVQSGINKTHTALAILEQGSLRSSYCSDYLEQQSHLRTLLQLARAGFEMLRHRSDLLERYQMYR